MKKLLLLCAAVLTATGLNTAAAQVKMHPAVKAPQKVMAVPQNEASTTGTKSLTVSYCGDDVGPIGCQNMMEIGAAIQIPAATAAAYEGAKVTKVKVGLGEISGPTKITIFIAKRLNNMTIQKEQFEIGPCEVDNYGYGKWYEFTLPEPYEITTTGFYVGYKLMPTSAEDWPVGVSEGPSDNYGNRFFYDLYGIGQSSWSTLPNVGLDYNVCIRAVVEGDSLPDNEIELTSVTAPSFVKLNEAFTLSGAVANKGVDAITSYEVSYQFGDMEPVVKNISDVNIAPGEKANLYISDAVYSGVAAVDVPATVTISKVNGEVDRIAGNNSASTSFISAANSYLRNVVVEEATGSTCGFCPSGIVGMEYMKEKYPDTFIGIAAHFSDFGYDPMEVETYSNLSHSSLPWADIDRTYKGIDPNAEYLEIYYNAERARPTFAKVDITDIVFSQDFKKVNVVAQSEFVLDIDNVDYRLAYVVLENNVGPYNQSNYFSGGGYGPMDGWESKGNPESTLYDDVARDIFDYNGIRGSVPANVAAGQKYEYSYEVDLRNVTNYKNMELAVLLIDSKSGEIINAVKVNEAQIAGVRDLEIDLDNNAPVVYYNLQGVQVSAEDLVPGIYVKRQGGKAEKVIIR